MADSDITFGRALCPAKGLLSKWSSCLNDQPLKERGLDLFVTYFERFLFTADDFSVPSMLAAAELKRGGDTKAKAVLLQLYRSHAPLDEPAFFLFLITPIWLGFRWLSIEKLSFFSSFLVTRLRTLNF